MSIQKTFAMSIALMLLLAIPSFAFCQQDETNAQAHRDASIERMQKRVTEIESEMKGAEFAHAQALGEEAFNLYSQIDQTFLQMKNAYQQQVIELNQRMQRKWEKIETADFTDRAVINESLRQLEKDWDLTFARLSKAHESHLTQLKDSLAKFQGEFSDAAGRAKAELEASNFEATSRWESGHELLLAINNTYVQIVEGQVDWQQKRVEQDPDDKDMVERLAKTRARYASIQGRFQRRLSSHLQHLDEELKTRLAQLTATKVWDSRREIMQMVDGLCARTHQTFELLQTSYEESSKALTVEVNEQATSNERALKLKASIKATKSILAKTYRSRVDFIGKQVEDYEARITKGASKEETATWTAKMTDLRLLSRSLNAKAAALIERPTRTVRR